MKRAFITVIVPIAALLLGAVVTISQLRAQEESAGTPATPAAPGASSEEAAPSAPLTKASTEQEKAPQEIIDAFDLFRQRDLDGTVKALKKAIKKNPDLPPHQVILAEFYGRANNKEGMIASLEQATIDSPDDAQAYFLLGSIALRDRHVAEARLLLEKADSLMSKLTSAKRKKALEPQILAGLATTSGAWGDWAGAQAKLEAWLKLDPENANAMQQLGQTLLKQKNEQAALEQLVQASKIDPKLLSPEAFLAQYYWSNGDQENAKKWMIAAINARPKELQTRLLAARWAFETGQLTEAKKQASAAMKLDPQSIDAQFLRGLIALFQKDYNAAEEYCQNAHLLSPKDFRVSNALALALIEQKGEEKKQRALEYAESNARQYPKVGEALSTYGWVLYKLDRLDDAERVLRGAISGGTFSPDTAYYLARLLNKRGHQKEAKQLLESALPITGPFQNRDDAKSLLDELKK